MGIRPPPAESNDSSSKESVLTPCSSSSKPARLHARMKTYAKERRLKYLTLNGSSPFQSKKAKAQKTPHSRCKLRSTNLNQMFHTQSLSVGKVAPNSSHTKHLTRSMTNSSTS